MLLCTNSKHFMQTKETTSLSRNRNGTPHTRNAFNTTTRIFQRGYYWARINTEPIFPLWKFKIFCCCCEYILPHTSIKPSIVSLTLLRAHRPVLTHSNGRSLFIESIRDIDSVSFMLKKTYHKNACVWIDDVLCMRYSAFKFWFVFISNREENRTKSW